MDEALVLQILEEAKRRDRLNDLVDVAAFDKQKDFIRDPSRRKAAICTRRAGKSFCIGLYLLQEAIANPESSCLYINLVRKQAKDSFWTKVLKRLNNRYSLGGIPNDTDLAMKFPNGSVIYCIGADTSPEQQERVRGDEHRLVVVDEAGSWRHDLRTFVKTALRPLTIDSEGTVCLIGTPRDVKNFFYDVTTGKEPGWSVHRWTGFDNVGRDRNGKTMAEKFSVEIEDIRNNDPRYVETAKYKQEYLGEWCIDEDMLVYRFREDRNWLRELPDDRKYQWHHVIGLDLGFNDESAWVVLAYHDLDPRVFVREVKTESKLITSQVAEFTQYLCDVYDPVCVVVDTGGLGKMVAEELRIRYSLPIEAATKHERDEFIRMFNSDLTTGRIVLLPGCEPLSDEWNGLAWDERALKMGRRVVPPGEKDHLSDACLYAWRKVRNYTMSEDRKMPAYGSQEEEDEELRRLRERVPDEPDWGTPNYITGDESAWW